MTDITNKITDTMLQDLGIKITDGVIESNNSDLPDVATDEARDAEYARELLNAEVAQESSTNNVPPEYAAVVGEVKEGYDDHEVITTAEPYGYPSLYGVKALTEAAYAEHLDLNKVMPDVPRLGWVANAKNWSVLATSSSPLDIHQEAGAADWFGACLASVGGFFVVSPISATPWDDEVIVPTPYGDAVAKQCLRLYPIDLGTNNVAQYIFVGLAEDISSAKDAVHNYMLSHLARMLNMTNSMLKQAMPETRLIGMLREGLSDPFIRWYANVPSYFVQMFMTKPQAQHRADCSYNAAAWFNKVAYNNKVMEDAINHYRLVLAPELNETGAVVDNDELIARAMMLNVRQRIVTSNEMRTVRKPR